MRVSHIIKKLHLQRIYTVIPFFKVHSRVRVITFLYKGATALDKFLIGIPRAKSSLYTNVIEGNMSEKRDSCTRAHRVPMSGQMGRVSGCVSCETHNSIVTPSLKFLRVVPTDSGTKLVLFSRLLRFTCLFPPVHRVSTKS